MNRNGFSAVVSFCYLFPEREKRGERKVIYLPKIVRITLKFEEMIAVAKETARERIKTSSGWRHAPATHT